MKRNLILTAVLLAAMIVSCTTAGGGAVDQDEPKVTLALKAEDADLVTDSQLQIEDANMNIGWWSSLNDQAKWTLEVPEDGEYSVVIRYSVADSFAGATVKLTVGETSVEWDVKTTNDWSSYTNKEVGKINLKAGSQPVVIQATNIKNRFVMNLTDIKFLKY